MKANMRKIKSDTQTGMVVKGVQGKIVYEIDRLEEKSMGSDML